MIENFLKAGYPALSILTHEPHRAEKLLPCDRRNFYAWDCIQGIRDIKGKKIVSDIRDPVEAVNWLNGYQKSVLIAHNLHLFVDIPEVIQAIQNNVEMWKAIGCTLITVSPVFRMPVEIEKFFHIIDMPLPDDDRMFEIQREIGDPLSINPNRKAARAAKGLTEFEIETAYSYSLVKCGYFSSKIISEAKAQMIRKSGLMEFWEPAKTSDLGGLGRLRSFIEKRSKAFSLENEDLPKIRAILLVGIPGTGKSLSSKATASILGWPLIRLDIGALKHSLVGESERRMRQATQTIDAFGKAVIWIDEVEKCFAGVKSSGQTDGGTTASMFGHFLTWMQETKSCVLIMATANDISQLPPEFMRAGRFDATFFTDLPTKSERIEIIKIMNRKWNSDIPITYADKLNNYTGAEIEQLAKDSLFDGLDEAYKALVPLSQTMREEVNSLREWAKNRARFANTEEQEPEVKRKVTPLKRKAG